LVDILDRNRRYRNLSPYGEPRLGKRGLYGSMGGRTPGEMQQAMLWVLNQSDGRHDLLAIAERSGTPFLAIDRAAVLLEDAGLLERIASDQSGEVDKE
jgi:aminopeptidase-like protein